MDLALNLGTLRRVLLEQYVYALYRHGLKSRHPKIIIVMVLSLNRPRSRT